MKPLVYYDQIHLYGKNLEQEKYRHMIERMNDISSQVGYDIMHCNNDDIKPVNSLESDAQKIITFDDFICDKNQKPLIDYFIQGRHKNCSVIYLSQSFYKTPKDIRLNCSHYVSLQCRRILGGWNLVRVRNVVVAAIFDFMTEEDWGE